MSCVANKHGMCRYHDPKVIPSAVDTFRTGHFSGILYQPEATRATKWPVRKVSTAEGILPPAIYGSKNFEHLVCTIRGKYKRHLPKRLNTTPLPGLPHLLY